MSKVLLRAASINMELSQNIIMHWTILEAEIQNKILNITQTLFLAMGNWTLGAQEDLLQILLIHKE